MFSDKDFKDSVLLQLHEINEKLDNIEYKIEEIGLLNIASTMEEFIENTTFIQDILENAKFECCDTLENPYHNPTKDI